LAERRNDEALEHARLTHDRLDDLVDDRLAVGCVEERLTYCQLIEREGARIQPEALVLVPEGDDRVEVVIAAQSVQLTGFGLGVSRDDLTGGERLELRSAVRDELEDDLRDVRLLTPVPGIRHERDRASLAPA